MVREMSAGPDVLQVTTKSLANSILHRVLDTSVDELRALTSGQVDPEKASRLVKLLGRRSPSGKPARRVAGVHLAGVARQAATLIPDARSLLEEIQSPMCSTTEDRVASAKVTIRGYLDQLESEFGGPASPDIVDPVLEQLLDSTVEGVRGGVVGLLQKAAALEEASIDTSADELRIVTFLAFRGQLESLRRAWSDARRKGSADIGALTAEAMERISCIQAVCKGIRADLAMEGVLHSCIDPVLPSPEQRSRQTRKGQDVDWPWSGHAIKLGEFLDLIERQASGWHDTLDRQGRAAAARLLPFVQRVASLAGRAERLRDVEDSELTQLPETLYERVCALIEALVSELKALAEGLEKLAKPSKRG